tara:strand:+ start:81 stop:803 length:723 start_codon:yes stop_codon:yes gene_type:complete
VRESGVTKYNGLIPKLFDNLDVYDKNIENIIKYDQIMKTHTHNSLFKRVVDYKGAFGHSPNLLHNSKYLSERDKSNVAKLNMEFYKGEDLSSKKKYLEFIEHLFKAHQGMEYGIYFGLRKADSEKDFLDSIKGTRPTSKDQSIIYYTNIENVIEYVDKVRWRVKYDTPLLYFNRSWQYGVKDEYSRDYDNKYDFICYLRHLENKDLELSETICQIPLPRELFKHTFKNITDTAFKSFGAH